LGPLSFKFVSDRFFKFLRFQISPLSFEFVSDRSFKFIRFQIGPLSFEFVSDRFFLSTSVKPKLKDLSETNSKLKRPIWNLINLKDLSETNSKLKRYIWNLRNLNDLCETNVKLKGRTEVFGLDTIKEKRVLRSTKILSHLIHVWIVRNHIGKHIHQIKVDRKKVELCCFGFFNKTLISFFNSKRLRRIPRWIFLNELNQPFFTTRKPSS